MALPKQAGNWIIATGRRKDAVARVFVNTQVSDTRIWVNGKSHTEYFPSILYQFEVEKPLRLLDLVGKVKVKAKVQGGGIKGQAEAIRHGIARALAFHNPEWRKLLKKAGLLTRDARRVERKKYGLKKARRAPQYSKR